MSLNKIASPTLYPPYGENLLINGGFDVWQRGTTIDASTTFPNDNDAYCADRWNHIAESNDTVDITQETSDLPPGARSGILMTVQTANQKFGIVEIVENANCAQLTAGNQDAFVSLSFWVKRSIQVSSVGAQVLSWSVGGADTVTSDVFTGGWGATDTAPTPTTNWTRESMAAQAADVGATVNWEYIQMPGIAIDTANMTNIAVAIYANDTDSVAAGQTLRLANVMLNAGKKCLPFQQRHIAQEEYLCRRYFQTSFERGTAPAINVGANTSELRTLIGAGGQTVIDYRFDPHMRTTPTAVYYNPSRAGSNEMENMTSGGEITIGAGSAPTNESEKHLLIGSDGDPQATAGDVAGVHFTADAEL